MKKYIIIFIAAFVCMFAVLAAIHLKMIQTAKQTPPADIPYLIVLGAKVNGETMSLSLLYRAEKGLEYLEENPETVVVVTGGQGEGEDITEAEALRRFYTENGIAEERILIEDQSTSTYENLLFTKELYPVDEAVIVSNDFHLYRASLLADKLDMETHSLAAKTPAVVKLQLYAREYLAIMKTKVFGK